ncbi:MAG: hypothetical protein KGJ62_05740 [Armatimonadetes bacterium]|nr:hypothetical protein [Armatimonadota bacterium]MDE2205996.1 hypothetical protein [Armatimonadota bacterium]
MQIARRIGRLVVVAGVAVLAPASRAQAPQRIANGVGTGQPGTLSYLQIGGPYGQKDPVRSHKFALLHRADVYAELSITSPEREKLDALELASVEGVQAQIRLQVRKMGGYRGIPIEERRQVMADRRVKIENVVGNYIDNVDGQLAQILTPQQMERLDQIDLQWRGPLAIAAKSIGEQLKLSGPQRVAIDAAYNTFNTAEQTAIRYTMSPMQALMDANNAKTNGGKPDAGGATQALAATNPLNSGGTFDQAAAQKAVTAAQKNAAVVQAKEEAAVLQALSPEQLQTWHTMLGRKFSFPFAQ